MRKWARRILATASLVLLVATLAAWARAQWATELFTRCTVADAASTTERVETQLGCCTNALLVVRRTGRFDVVPGAKGEAFRREVAAEVGFVRQSVSARAIPSVDFVHGLWGFAWARRPASGEEFFDARSVGHPGGWTAVRNHTAWLAVPWWFLALTFSLAPARAAGRWRKARRRPPHACPGCGYDLRATADAVGPLLPTCPECGRTASDPAAPPRRAA